MPNRIIKESIWTSPNFNKLSGGAERHFFRCLVAADDYGCFEATTAVLKGKLYPLHLATCATDIEKWNQELEKCQLIRLWLAGERIYAQFTSWDRHNELLERHTPATPCPPWLLDENGFDPRIATETLQAYKRIAVAINALGEMATYREITKMAQCSMSTLSKYNKQLHNNPLLQFATDATDATPKNPKPNPNHNHKPTNSSLSIEDVYEVYKKEIMGCLDESASIPEDMEEELKATTEIFTAPWVIDAIREGVKRKRKDWRYITGILKNWKRYGKDADFPKGPRRIDPDKYIKGKYGHMVRR